MALLKPSLPDVHDMAEWQTRTRRQRMQVTSRHWVDHGFGSPLLAYGFYLLKLVVYVGGAILLISATTPGIGGVTDIASWWTEGIVYQKLIVWTLLYEIIGLGCGSGPLTSRFMPPIGSVLYWLRPGTIRLLPWPGAVPFTAGSRRTVVDVALYALVLASAIHLLLQPGELSVEGAEGVGLLAPLNALPLIISVALLGLRDKTIFLAARGEQFWLSLFILFFAFDDQLIGFQLVMLALWWGAATSKLNHRFPYVVAVMMSNAPFMRITAIKRAMYRSYPDDLRPSWIPAALAHVGTVTEYAVPLVLVFLGDGGPVTWIALIYMAVFHLHILPTIPMGVPLEWNVFFIFSLFYLFGAHSDVTVWDLQNPWLLAVLLPSLLLLPILGNVRPDLVSFLPAMRYYAGSWGHEHVDGQPTGADEDGRDPDHQLRPADRAAHPALRPADSDPHGGEGPDVAVDALARPCAQRARRPGSGRGPRRGRDRRGDRRGLRHRLELRRGASARRPAARRHPGAVPVRPGGGAHHHAGGAADPATGPALRDPRRRARAPGERDGHRPRDARASALERGRRELPGARRGPHRGRPGRPGRSGALVGR